MCAWRSPGRILLLIEPCGHQSSRNLRFRPLACVSHVPPALDTTNLAREVASETSQNHGPVSLDILTLLLLVILAVPHSDNPRLSGAGRHGNLTRGIGAVSENLFPGSKRGTPDGKNEPLEPCDLDGAWFVGKLIVPTAGEAYDAQAKSLRRKFRPELKSGGYALYLSNQEKHSERGDSCYVVIRGR